MRFTALVFVAILLAGCATHRDDARLQGTWHSNRDATVAAAFQRDPRWTNATPQKVERFKDMFGHMTVSYTNGMVTTDYRGEIGSFAYRVLETGSNYVVVHFDTPIDQGRVKIRFVDGDNSYWIDSGPFGFGLQERFDRVTTPPKL
jgi:hypothetical protein